VAIAAVSCRPTVREVALLVGAGVRLAAGPFIALAG
jgi:hypothetical protein